MTSLLINLQFGVTKDTVYIDQHIMDKHEKEICTI